MPVPRSRTLPCISITDNSAFMFAQNVGSGWGGVNFISTDQFYWRDRPGGADNVNLKIRSKNIKGLNLQVRKLKQL